MGLKAAPTAAAPRLAATAVTESKPSRRTRSNMTGTRARSEEHTSELQSRFDLVCRLLLEKKKNQKNTHANHCDQHHTPLYERQPMSHSQGLSSQLQHVPSTRHSSITKYQNMYT